MKSEYKKLANVTGCRDFSAHVGHGTTSDTERPRYPN